MASFTKKLESGATLTFSYNAGTSALNNCGLGAITSVYGTMTGGQPTKENPWDNPYGVTAFKEFSDFWPVLDENKDKIIASLGGFNTILISDRADMGSASGQNLSYFKAYNFVEWLIARGIGAVWQSPTAFNHCYGRTHITQVWAWYPRTDQMVDLDTPSFISKEFRKLATDGFKDKETNPHSKKYFEWREYLINVFGKIPMPKASEIKPAPVDPGIVQKQAAIQAADYNAIRAGRPWNKPIIGAAAPKAPTVKRIIR